LLEYIVATITAFVACELLCSSSQLVNVYWNNSKWRMVFISLPGGFIVLCLWTVRGVTTYLKLVSSSILCTVMQLLCAFYRTSQLLAGIFHVAFATQWPSVVNHASSVLC